MFIPKILSIEKKVYIFMDITEEAIAAAVFHGFILIKGPKSC